MAEFVSLFMILLLLCVISAIKLTDRQRFEVYLSDIDLIKITCNNGHFPMDMLEQDEIIDNLRRVELY